jgi:hypothetical protein
VRAITSQLQYNRAFERRGENKQRAERIGLYAFAAGSTHFGDSAINRDLSTAKPRLHHIPRAKLSGRPITSTDHENRIMAVASMAALHECI